MESSNPQEILEDIIRRMEDARPSIDTGDEDRDFANARINGYIRTAQTALRSAQTIARQEDERSDGGI